MTCRRDLQVRHAIGRSLSLATGSPRCPERGQVWLNADHPLRRLANLHSIPPTPRRTCRAGPAPGVRARSPDSTDSRGAPAGHGLSALGRAHAQPSRSKGFLGSPGRRSLRHLSPRVPRRPGLLPPALTAGPPPSSRPSRSLRQTRRLPLTRVWARNGFRFRRVLCVARRGAGAGGGGRREEALRRLLAALSRTPQPGS